ncbi:hypothetical protein AcW2_004883 [Taiwanofungus camphoratus]|nr:hypothetical protein AcW2_004883 [Antrodia cinnamomea]
MRRSLRAGSEKASSVCLTNPESSPMGEGVHANLGNILRDHSRRNRTTRCRNMVTHTRSSPAVVRADVGGGDISRTRLGRRHGRGTSCAVGESRARTREVHADALKRCDELREDCEIGSGVAYCVKQGAVKLVKRASRLSDRDDISGREVVGTL